MIGAVVFSTIGEIACEISEGLMDGFNDFKEIFRENLKTTLRAVFKQEHHLEGPLNQLIWFNLESAYKHRSTHQTQILSKVRSIIL